MTGLLATMQLATGLGAIAVGARLLGRYLDAIAARRRRQDLAFSDLLARRRSLRDHSAVDPTPGLAAS